MEVINFKTAYSVHDKVYILVGGEIRLGKIAAIAFCGDGYAYACGNERGIFKNRNNNIKTQGERNPRHP